MGGVASVAIEYDAFWMLNSLVNQYQWHCIGMYNKLKPAGAPRLHYKPIVWSMSRLLYTPEDDDVIKTLKEFVKPFPGIGAFSGWFSTFKTYTGVDMVQKGGGGALGDALMGAEIAGGYSIIRSFQLLNAIWNTFRWYLLELRRLRQDPEVNGMEHTYVSTSTAMPFGKLFRGHDMFRPIDDPVLNGLEYEPPLQKFIDEIHSGMQQLRRASSNVTRRRSSSERRRRQSKRSRT